MNRIFLISAYLLGFTISASIAAADCIPTLIVIRHGEDSATNDADNNLAEEGQAHAKAIGELFKDSNKLNQMLKDNVCPIKQIYKNTTPKPDQTAGFIGKALGISPTFWPPSKGYGDSPITSSPKLTAGGSTVLVLNRQTTSPFLNQAITDPSNKGKINSAGSIMFNYIYLLKNQTLGGFNPFKNVDIYLQTVNYGGKAKQCYLRLPKMPKNKPAITIDGLAPVGNLKSLNCIYSK